MTNIRIPYLKNLLFFGGKIFNIFEQACFCYVFSVYGICPKISNTKISEKMAYANRLQTQSD